MPKLVVTMNDFSGGQNSTTAPRDLDPNELVLCRNMDPNNKGMLHTGRALADTAFTVMGGEPTTGYGLVAWSNDYRLDAAATEGFIGQFIGKMNATNLDVFETADGLTGTVRNAVVTGLGTSPAYYVAEGDLFIGGHTAGTFVTPKTLSMHRREDFPGMGIARSVQDWKVLTQAKAAPSSDMSCTWGFTSAGDATPAGNAMTAEQLKWIVRFNNEDTGGWINDKNQGTEAYIELAGSWLYKNGAESGLTNLGLIAYNGRDLNTSGSGAVGDAVSSGLGVQAWINAVEADTHDKAARTGARLYSKLKSDSTWYTVAEVSWEKGIIGDLESEWTPWVAGSGAAWNDSAADPAIVASTGWIKNPAETFTFESWNQYKESLIPTGNVCYFKTGCIANSRAYIANVKINDRVYPDRIFKSPVFQYDVFTEDLIIDTALNDGDEIVKLVAHADRLLMFKHNSVMVLNISQIDEQVESEFVGAGIDNPGAVIKTPAGVAWVNRNGAYLFNGEVIKSLNQRQELAQ